MGHLKIVGTRLRCDICNADIEYGKGGAAVGKAAAAFSRVHAKCQPREAEDFSWLHEGDEVAAPQPAYSKLVVKAHRPWTAADQSRLDAYEREALARAEEIQRRDWRPQPPDDRRPF